MEEYLLNEENNRLTIYPIQNEIIWNEYKKQQAAFWTAEEIDFSKDYEDFQKLNQNEQYFIKMILAFFSSSDTIVNINLGERFLKDIKIREAIVAYTWQMAMESIHCVSSDTKILIDKGFFEISSLENQKVNVWNGKDFRETIIKYTGDQELYEVTLSNGIKIKSTSEHKWYINNNESKEIIYTESLNINDIIYDYNLPIIDPIDPILLDDIFIKGYNYIKDYNNNLEVIVPINFSIKTKILWLEGLLTYIQEENLLTDDNDIIIYLDNYIIMSNIQLLLLTFNIKSDIIDDYICINNFNDLYKYNFSININKINVIHSNIKIKKIQKLEGIYKTYCFNESYEHSGIFNGILTGQSETYSLQINNIIKDINEKNKLFNALKEFPFIAQKAEWAYKWIDSNESFSKRILAFAIVEGIFFSGSFCSIFWLKKKNIMPGLCNSNELIARDEANHVYFAILLYSLLLNKLEEAEVHEIFKEAVDIEIEFICNSLPCSLLGMNSLLMTEYIKYVADRLLIDLNYNIIYNSKNPFDFMESISVEGKTNFFENRPTQYQKASILNKTKHNIFNVNNNF